MQILEIQLAEWTSIYYDQSLMTRERAGSHHDDRVGELNSEDPPRIYNHPQHRRIVLATSTQKYHLAGESEIHEWAQIETFPPIQIVCVQIDEILVGKAGIIRIGKGRTIGSSMTSGDR